MEVTASTTDSAAQPQMSLTSNAGLAVAPSTIIQRRMSSISPWPFAERLAALASSLEGAVDDAPALLTQQLCLCR